MNKILDNPKEYFDNLSKEEFKNLLDEFGFEYEDMTSLSDEGKEEYKQIVDNLFKDTDIQVFEEISEKKIAIIGNTGLGSTSLIECLKNIGVESIEILSKEDKEKCKNSIGGIKISSEVDLNKDEIICILNMGFSFDREKELEKALQEAEKEILETKYIDLKLEDKSTHKKKNKKVKNWEKTRFYQR
jgi:hypothetical protein